MVKDIVLDKLSYILQRIETEQKALWVRSFLSRHKGLERKTLSRRTLEQHEASKHQVELVLECFRNVYHAEAFGGNLVTYHYKWKALSRIIVVQRNNAAHNRGWRLSS